MKMTMNTSIVTSRTRPVIYVASFLSHHFRLITQSYAVKGWYA